MQLNFSWFIRVSIIRVYIDYYAFSNLILGFSLTCTVLMENNCVQFIPLWIFIWVVFNYACLTKQSRGVPVHYIPWKWHKDMNEKCASFIMVSKPSRLHFSHAIPSSQSSTAFLHDLKIKPQTLLNLLAILKIACHNLI